MIGRIPFVGLAVFISASCGGSPTAPSSATSQLFRAGVYAISLTADGSACPGSAALPSSVVYSEAAMAFEDGVWRARPVRPAAGSFDIQFVPGPLGPTALESGSGLVGTATGNVVSTFTPVPLAPVPDLRATLGGEGPVTFNGGVSNDVLASGFISGRVVFSNSAGITVSCNSSVPWFMSWRGPV